MLNEELNGQLHLAQIDPLHKRQFTVRKRDGRIVPFDETRICLAIESAFKADAGISPDEPLTETTQAEGLRLTNAVVDDCVRRAVRGEILEIELIQDCVETQLMAFGHHGVARRYILYREERRKARALRGDRRVDGQLQGQLFVSNADGTREPLDPQRVRRDIIRACRGLEEQCSWRAVADETVRNLYDGVRPEEISKAMIFAARARVELEPAYTFVAARLLLSAIYHEALPKGSLTSLEPAHREGFRDFIQTGVRAERLDPALLTFGLNKLTDALRPERDEKFWVSKLCMIAT